MDDSYVCSGATMRCTMGTSTAKLTVLPSRTVYLAGQPMANINDHVSFVNLGPFGRCRSMGFPATASATAAHHGHLTPMPCMHNTPFPWMNGKNDFIIKDGPALLKSCTCSCLWGGTISLIDNGQFGDGTKYVQQKDRETFSKGTSEKSIGVANKTNGKTSTQVSKKSTKKHTYPPQQVNQWKQLLKQSKGKTMEDKDADDKNANPAYHKPSKDLPVNFNGKVHLSHRVNCCTTSLTFMLRKKGYNVTAKGYSNNINTAYLAAHPFDAWKKSDGTQAKPTLIKEIAKNEAKANPLNSNTQIYYKALSEQCKTPGYYQLVLTWKDGTRHSTIIKSASGKFESITTTTDGITRTTTSNIVLSNIEPQSGDSLDIVDLFEKMATPDKLSEQDGIMRIDDKRFNEDYLDVLNFKPSIK